ncbi:terminase large subunit [Arthrobacter phage Kumotta]|uniref:Terminase n=1 Tax=Arthrobacter phage Kumotta TaxID=2588498 RepID=A0A4Y6ELB3_9CAUD|nr:terminase large subunit [Arthrobacter phage Kumotta]QDF19513.1 terminase [Arthrobacter phage Kumotta]
MRNGVLAEARHLVLPEGIKTSGFPAVEATCQRIGIVFDQWQRDLNRCILAKDASGLYAADTVAMSIPRQVGKTFDVGALVFADSIINAGTTTVWTAHRFKVSRETFNELRTWAKTPLLAPHIEYDDITTAAGNECIPFRNGSRIVFAARERGAIRGFTKVRRLILDEAQILTEAAMSDLAPTMNQANNPQIIMMGTPPKPGDPGEVFTALRKSALDGESEGALYAEFSASPGSPINVNEPGFWEAMAEANPSFPLRTTKRAIKRLRKLLTDDDYRREAQGIWDSDGRVSLFAAADWDAGRKEARPEDLAISALAVAVSMDLAHSAIVAGSVDGDGNVWVKGLHYGPGTRGVVDRCVEWQAAFGADVVLDGRGPGAVLIPHLEKAGVRLHIASTGDVLDAFANLETKVRDGEFFFVDSPEIDDAAVGAVRRPVGDRFALGRKKSESDISPLEAASLAAWATGVDFAPAFFESDYETQGVMSI